MNWKLVNTHKKKQDIEHNYGVCFSELLVYLTLIPQDLLL